MDNLITALATTGYSFARYAWDTAPSGDYGVVSVEGASDFVCGNKHVEKGLNCIVDYFTRDASSTPKDTIETALNAFPYSLRSTQFEDDTGYIHYEWAVGIYGS